MLNRGPEAARWAPIGGEEMFCEGSYWCYIGIMENNMSIIGYVLGLCKDN